MGRVGAGAWFVLLFGWLSLGPSAAAEWSEQEPSRAQQDDESPWPARWEALDRLLAREDSLLRDELAELQRELARSPVSESVGDASHERFRVALLGAALGQPGPDWASVELPPDIDPELRERALAYLPPGEARASALVAGLLNPDGTPAELAEDKRLQLQDLGFRAFVEEHDAFRVGPARRLAAALHTSAQATWSTMCVEGIARRSGDYKAAQQVVRTQLEVTPATAPAERIELLQRLAIAAAGGGDWELEAQTLGRALRLGGDDALQILGKTALFEGHSVRARRLFGALLQRAQSQGVEPAPWALRGWGLSLIPGAASQGQ